MDSTVAGDSAQIEFTGFGKKIAWGRTSVFDWLFVVLGGLPFYLPLLFLLGENGLGRQHPIYWYFWVNAVVSAPHVYATYCRLARKISEGRVSWLAGFPCYLAMACFLGYASLKGFYLQAMTGVNVWQSIHYVRQGYGVSRVYSHSSLNDALGKKMSYLAFHLAMPLFVLGRWHTLYTVWGGKPSTAIIPVHFSAWCMNTCWLLGAIAVVLGIAAEIRTYQSAASEYDPTRAVAMVVFFAIHVFGFLSIRCYQRGFFAVTIFHALQYLSLVWKFERIHAVGKIERVVNLIPVPIAFPLFWGVLFVGGYYFENHLIHFANRLWPYLPGVLLSAVSAHHYAVDTVMWRRKAGT